MYFRGYRRILLWDCGSSPGSGAWFSFNGRDRHCPHQHRIRLSASVCNNALRVNLRSLERTHRRRAPLLALSCRPTHKEPRFPVGRSDPKAAKSIFSPVKFTTLLCTAWDCSRSWGCLAVSDHTQMSRPLGERNLRDFAPIPLRAVETAFFQSTSVPQSRWA